MIIYVVHICTYMFIIVFVCTYVYIYTCIYVVVHVLKVVHEALQEPVAFEVVSADEAGKVLQCRFRLFLGLRSRRAGWL